MPKPNFFLFPSYGLQIFLRIFFYFIRILIKCLYVKIEQIWKKRACEGNLWTEKMCVVLKRPSEGGWRTTWGRGRLLCWLAWGGANLVGDGWGNCWVLSFNPLVTCAIFFIQFPWKLQNSLLLVKNDLQVFLFFVCLSFYKFRVYSIFLAIFLTVHF